jgi:quercetin dioxygenase-like cupin family protein
MFSALPSRRMRATRSASLATLMLAIVVGTAFATGASGFHGTPLARGTTVGPMQFNVGDIKFQTKARVDVAYATVTIDPLGSSGWHSHPGVVLVTVSSGTVTFYNADCTSNTYAAGASFVESNGATGLARNESTTTPAIVYVTYIVPAGAPALRIDQPNPGCPQS